MSVESVAAALARASRDRQTVSIAGAGTKRHWGSPAPDAAITLSTRELDAPIEHRYGDLTATVPAGATLADVNRELARHGQWIALDPPWFDRATIGGIVATNDSGPRRHRFGAPRDNIIGVDLVRADGTRAKAGGIVVKNVAGYDLGRLMTGSFGSLAVIASATFKLYPIPPASRTVIVDAEAGSTTASAERVGAIVAALAASHLTPTAVELQGGGSVDGSAAPQGCLRLLVRFESIETAAEEQATAMAQLAKAHGATVTIDGGPAEAAAWNAHAQRPWTAPGAVLKLSVLPADLTATLAWLGDALRGCEWEAVGRAGIGVLLVRIGGDAAQQAPVVSALRARFAPGRGSVVIVRGSDELKRTVDVWGPAGDALPIMRAIKQQFDPHALLNPGRGPFGI